MLTRVSGFLLSFCLLSICTISYTPLTTFLRKIIIYGLVTFVFLGPSVRIRVATACP